MMSKVAVIYEGDKSLLDKGLMSQIEGELEFYDISDSHALVAYRKLKQMLQLGLAAALFLVVPAHADAAATQQKIVQISQTVGIEPVLVQAGDVATQQTPQFGFAKGTFIMADDFDEPLDEFKEYME